VEFTTKLWNSNGIDAPRKKKTAVHTTGGKGANRNKSLRSKGNSSRNLRRGKGLDISLGTEKKAGRAKVQTKRKHPKGVIRDLLKKKCLKDAVFFSRQLCNKTHRGANEENEKGQRNDGSIGLQEKKKDGNDK